MTARQDSKSRQVRVVRSACAFWLLALAMGCSGGNNNLQPDPLTGNQLPVPVAGVAAQPAAPAKSDPAAPLPALAAPNAAVSTAALAAATTPQPDGKPDVRIGPPPAAKLAGATAVSSGGETSGPVTLKQPQPASGPADSSPLTRLGSVSPLPAAGGDAEWDRLFQRLKDLGMNGFRLELDRDTSLWRCTCSIPDRRNPRLKQNYSATGAAAPVAALRAVVEEVERDPR